MIAAMPLPEIVRVRRDTVAADLDRVDATLQSIEGPDSLVKRLQPIVHMEVERLRERLATLPDDASVAWPALIDIGNKAARVAAETLSFVGGVAARSAGLDRGSCDLADRLLAAVGTDLLEAYQPVTVPASGEYIDVLSDVIRVRYPGAGVWDLPVVLHEFGHYVEPRLGRPDSPVTAIIRREADQRPFLGSFAGELWGDVFATYVAGPAYAFSCLSRFAPTTAHDDAKPTHPSPVKRAVAVFHALDATQAAWERGGRASGSLDPLAKSAREWWAGRLEGAGVAAEPSAEERSYAVGLAAEFVAVLDASAPAVRYDDATVAAAVRRSLADPAIPRPETVSIVDALNGGWWARHAAEAAGRADRVPAITKAVGEICAKI
jgi:hypothetical protein